MTYKNKPHSRETRNRALKRLEKGDKINDIARELHVSRTTIRRWKNSKTTQTETCLEAPDKFSESVLVPGRAFGPYKVEKMLGKGGMGEVYQVLHEDLRQQFAIKLISSDLIRDAQALERFKDEARKSFQINHTNIVNVDHFDSIDGKYYIRMELMEGVSASNDSSDSETGEKCSNLDQFLEKVGGVLDEETTKQYLTDILDGLIYAHRHRLIHRDLKPANILLNAECAKIGDFGLVKAIGEETIQSKIRLSISRSRLVVRDSSMDRSLSDSKTPTLDASELSYIGTYDYMSPEQREGEEATIQSDLYSVGLMAYRMLTGKKVIGMKPISRMVPGLHPNWDSFIAKATDQDPNERFQSADEMLAAFMRDIVDAPEDLQIKQTVNSGQQSFSFPFPKPRYFAYGAFGLTLFVLLFVGYSFISDEDRVDTTVDPWKGLKTQLRSEISQMEKQLPETESTLRDAESDLEGSRVRLDRVETRLDGETSNAELHTIESDLSSINRELGRIKISEIQEGVMALQDSRDAIKKDLDVLEANFESESSDDAKVFEGFAAINEKVEKLSDSINDLEVLHDSLNERVNKLKGILSNRQQSVLEYGNLRVSTVPSGVRASIAGVSGLTPMVFENLTLNTDHELLLELEHHDSVKRTVRLEKEGEEIFPTVTMQKSRGRIFVQSVPASARYFLRNTGNKSINREGITPSWEENLELGDYTVEFEHPDWPSKTEYVSLSSSEAKLDFKFETGNASISSIPEGAEVRLDGSYVGLTPLVISDLIPKQYALSLTMKGYEESQISLEINESETSEHLIVLEKLKGPHFGNHFEIEVPGNPIEMLFVSSGNFLMGSEYGAPTEKPVRMVTLSNDFWIAKTEISQTQWNFVMGHNPSHFNEPRNPVESITWDDAMEFCDRLTMLYRQKEKIPSGYAFTLPTEAQWEYACKAGTKGEHSQGSLHSKAWYSENSNSSPHPVGSKIANRWGAQDMLGNVYEWCLDYYDSRYYSRAPATDPMGPRHGSIRVIRGGAWNSDVFRVRDSDRRGNSPTFPQNYIGFRVVLSSKG